MLMPKGRTPRERGREPSGIIQHPSGRKLARRRTARGVVTAGALFIAAFFGGKQAAYEIVKRAEPSPAQRAEGTASITAREVIEGRRLSAEQIGGMLKGMGFEGKPQAVIEEARVIERSLRKVTPNERNRIRGLFTQGQQQAIRAALRAGDFAVVDRAVASPQRVVITKIVAPKIGYPQASKFAWLGGIIAAFGMGIAGWAWARYR